ncbi:modifier of mdg4-like isoform X4 [Drosophila serrata]|uniref:modifier of mdg4-like isoform X4 n=1 Tax=Drosophila serrata TaxID=7274 RepID=UPI000A1D2AF0|nr:modifier of mdg4-like isoform X4 [Drosophila serrata]
MADDEQFSLCWNNFNTNLSAGFHESLCRGDLVDVSLAAEGHIVKAHRLVLSVCSPFFRKMFTQMPSNTHAIVFLNNVSHSALKDLIQFMYCGEVNVKQDALPAFISTAESLQIKGLTDNDPAPQPPQEPSPPPPAAPNVQQQAPAQRVQRQQPRASARYKIETVDDGLGDDNKGTTQIVIQTTAAPQATIVQQPQQQQQQQQQASQIQTQQQLQTGTTTTATLVSTNKRSAPRSSLTTSSSSGVKRSKTSVSANVIDPLDSATETGTTTTTTQQLVPQQITVQTTVVSAAESKLHQQQQVRQQQQEEAEYIDLPMELPTKSEPDYSEDHGDAAGDGEGTYVEDDAYGDMRYDDSYFTENEDAGNQSAANTSGGGVTATTSKAVVKQNYSDSSFVDTSADQGNTEAQDGNELVFIESPWSTPCLVLNGYMYNCHSRKSNKQYWRCHNYSKKVHEMRCRSRCVLENGRLKSVTGGLHNHQPHTDKIEKIVQRNKLAAVGCLGRKHSRTHSFVQEPKTEEEEEEEYNEEEQPQLVSSEAASLHLTDHELMHASLMLVPE